MHLPPPNLPRFGGGERPPFSCKPIAPLTITMGQRLIFRPIIVPRPNHSDPPPLQALTPRERHSRFLITRPSGPLSRHGKGGGGKGQMRCGYLGSDSVRSTDCFPAPAANQSVSSTASDRGLGAAPQACFGSFYTSKRNATAASRTGGHLSVTSPRRRRLQTTPAGQACLLIPCKRLAPPQAPTNCFTNTKPS